MAGVFPVSGLLFSDTVYSDHVTPAAQIMTFVYYHLRRVSMDT